MSSDKYTPAGVISRGGGQFLCICGGVVWANWDGEITSHTNPYYPTLKHEAIFPEALSGNNG